MKLLALSYSIIMLASGVAAQTNCNEGSGPLNPAQPASISPAEIIRKFSDNEARFKQAQAAYTYTRDIVIQTLAALKFGGTTVTGQYQLVSQITFDSQGHSLEKVIFAPQSTLREVALTREDFDDLRALAGFMLTPADLPDYDVRYAGQQHVDDLDTYVFDVQPKHLDKDRRYFEGRVWIETADLAIVKTCGKRVPDRRTKKDENLSPKAVTFREQIDGRYWFPTYSRADDVLRFARSQVHIRETVKFTKYERPAATGAIRNQGASPDGLSNARDARPKDKQPPGPLSFTFLYIFPLR